MKLILLFLTLISGYTTFLAATISLDRAKNITNKQINSVESPNLNNYFAHKGKPLTAPSNSFQALLISPPQVLAIATVAAEIKNETVAKSFAKTSYTIAVLGDSMVDVMGEGLPHLTKDLKNRFTKISFNLLNYGAAATNIEYGLVRLANNYSYLGKNVPSLLSQNPDIVVIESFAYNHWDNNESDLNRHWLTIAKLIDTVKNYNPKTKIVLAATTAPFCPTYTEGSANLPPPRKQIECETVKAYLQNMVNFAKSEHYPFADAYSASLKGSEGNPKYINQSDHIHMSEAGKQMFAQKLAEAIAITLK